MARVAAEVLVQQRQAKRAKRTNAEDDPYWHLKFMRNACWFTFLLSASLGAFLSVLHWAEKLVVANGVISWLSAGVAIYCLIGALSLQCAIHHRQKEARIERLENAVNVGAEMLRAEIREAFSALRVELEMGCARFVQGIDTAAIARLAGQMQGIELLIPTLRADRQMVLKEIEDRLPGVVSAAMREAHAAGYVAGVSERLNGRGGTVVKLEKP